MKKSIFLSVILAFALNANAYDFMVANADGVELAYKIVSKDSTNVAVVPTAKTTSWGPTVVNYPNIIDDTIRIPNTVIYNNKPYIVSSISTNTFANVMALKKLIIPETVINVDIFAMNYNCGIEEIIVAEENPAYKSIDGILYTKDMSRLCCYPTCKKDSIYIIPEGPQIVGMCAFLSLCYLRDITFPLSLNKMEYLAMIDTVINRAVFQDNVRVFEVNSITLSAADEIILGNQVDTFNQPYIAHQKPLLLTCRTVIPPYFPLQSAAGLHLSESELRVPMQSVAAYQQAEGWKLFGKIVSIEPPVVSGLNDVQVSWVQNFSATGYVWTLYLDEEHTQRFMTLIFDANGHLTNIDIASNNVPARMPALYEEDVDEPTHFAEYYTFTITGLSANTSYYFVRQSLNGTEIIDEEVGTFATQSNTTALENVYGAPAPTKVISNGTIMIKQGDKTYTITGIEAR